MIWLAHLLLASLWITQVSSASIRGERYPNEQGKTIAENKPLFLWFSSFRRAGSNEIISSTEDCDYDDPNKIQNCPPALSSMAVYPNYFISPSSLSLPSKCIEDPEDPECRRMMLQINFPVGIVDLPGGVFTDRAPSPPVTSFVTDFPHGAIATSAPTKDMCYGNMVANGGVHHKFCYSEMPSVSMEPSVQPTGFPQGGQSAGDRGDDIPSTDEPSVQPSASPVPKLVLVPVEPSSPPSNMPPPNTTPSTIVPSTQQQPNSSPSEVRIGQCQGDCDADEDCEAGLYCYQRAASEAVPGCPGSETDESRTDYCTDVAPVMAPVRPSTCDSFRLKLYWEEGYYWQEVDIEREWCAACLDQVCREGETLLLHECAWDSAYFDFVDLGQDEDAIWIHAVDTNLCLERILDDTSTTLEICDATNPLQRWTAPDGNCMVDRFEIGQKIDDEDYCLTTHHHPKYGEEVELFPCSVARSDKTSYWNRF
jgi:hypothetical protein